MTTIAASIDKNYYWAALENHNERTIREKRERERNKNERLETGKKVEVDICIKKEKRERKIVRERYKKNKRGNVVIERTKVR